MVACDGRKGVKYGKKDRLSKFVSLILRHNPDAAHITLDEHGWANVEELLAGIQSTGRKIDMKILEEIVDTDNKQRYSFNPDKTLIKVNQGHSIAADVELKEQEPPEFVYEEIYREEENEEDCGIDVNGNGDIFGGNPIRSAAENGQIDMIELLYNSGTVFGVSDATKNPLFGAIYGGLRVHL